ncbi:MAG: rod shape-determining protein MreD, partial [Desulfobacterales bacterium]
AAMLVRTQLLTRVMPSFADGLPEPVAEHFDELKRLWDNMARSDWYEMYCDLFILVVYLALFRPMRESFPMAIIFGFVMDSLSGGPLGLYVTTYFWSCAGILGVMTFLDIRSRFLLPMVVASVVIVENALFGAGTVMFVPDARMDDGILSTVSVQVLWAVVTGPLFIILLEAVHKRMDRWISEYRDKEDGYSQT